MNVNEFTVSIYVFHEYYKTQDLYNINIKKLKIRSILSTLQFVRINAQSFKVVTAIFVMINLSPSHSGQNNYRTILGRSKSKIHSI